ncbi:type I restriction endonuclease [Deinococcus cellulosilyticus]|uniref:Restriction endonuclease type I HsdR N-terminal domain-containing protein n=1 Tax=Deinococcus cellulosilyticus (strain DSM 18568 / NBRC 106333 / KACC 11606 / 5516J-15) TaxID=1223518 RepID=A0A511N3M7_DEIC1|nr:type I restriction endonuclease [Deinococcus cellulosilyticus]GEM47445.1 hypothetical protein DC3_30800 [Deinococcus cellulosilyticus NBRC 106333 = KACC 11606]
MDLAASLDHFAKQIPSRISHIQGEEATKHALILPFLGILGYDVYNPTEVRPEYAADFSARKRGQFEKVDYAIIVDGEVSMLIEAKAHNQKTEIYSGQLARYFNSTPTARVAIVTNGIEYRFFTDLKDRNIMDSEAFMVFNVLDHDSSDLELLQRFTRSQYQPSSISSLAEEVMCLQNITTYIYNQLQNPSENFVRFVVEELNLRQRITSRVVERYLPILRTAIHNALGEIQGNTAGTGPVPPPATKPTPPALTRKSRTEPAPAPLPDLLEDEKAVLESLKEILDCNITCHKEEDTVIIPAASGQGWALRFNTVHAKPHLIFNLDPEVARVVAGHVFFFSHPLGTKANFASLGDLYGMREIIAHAYRGT